jgi:PadR family transcriptional regulator, regulatory protein PadR
MAFRGDLYALILGTLQGGPLHGYEIVKRIRETGAAGRLSEGQIYPYLHKLESEGMVTAEWQTDTGAAPRRVYQLTPSGFKELERQKGVFEKFIAGVGGLLAVDPVKGGGNA